MVSKPDEGLPPKRVVVLGGGVAGVCCAQELCRLLPDADVALVSADAVVKGIKGVTWITRNLEEVTLQLQNMQSLRGKNMSAIQARVSSIDIQQKRLILEDGADLPFDQLCICSGAVPKKIFQHPNVIALRDQDSVQDMQRRLQSARKVMIVGNGGIALELVHALRGVQLVWAVRSNHIGDAFFDLDAAAFLFSEMDDARAGEGAAPAQDALQSDEEGKRHGGASLPRLRRLDGHNGSGSASASFCQRQGYDGIRTGSGLGRAVGPQWADSLLANGVPTPSGLTVEYECEVQQLEGSSAASPGEGSGEPWPVTVCLSNGSVHGVDFVVSATGVSPATQWLPPEIERNPSDGGIVVDEHMQTSVPGVFAAGDVCCAKVLEQQSAHWFQMRLWTQARTMGTYAARCMFNAVAAPEERLESGLHFELFTHVTRFYGKKVILLGLYNGQRLENEPSRDIVTYSRSIEGPNSTFVRVLLLRGRMQGAVLIGDTDLEETFENLILDQLDLSRYGPDLLDPDTELDHVFD